METTGLTHAPDRKRRFGRRTIARVLLAVALLVVLFQFVDHREILEAYSHADGFLIAAAAALLVFNIGIQVLKWRYLLLRSGLSFPWADITKSLLFGITAGTLTPGQLGEFGARGFHLASDNPERVIGLTIVDKLQMLAVMIIGGSISIAILMDLHRAAVVVVFVAAGMVSLLLLNPPLAGRLLRKTGLGRVQNKWIIEFLEAVDSLHARSTISMTVLYTVLFYVTIWIQLHLLLNAFTPVTLTVSFLAYAAMMLTKAVIPITFGDLGTREIGLVYFLSLRSVPEAAAFNAGILLFVMNILLPAIIGLLFIPNTFTLRKR